MKKSIKQNNIDHSMTMAIVIFILLVFSALQISAQEVNKKDKTDNATKTIKTPNSTQATDRKSVVQGKSVDLGGRRIIKKKKKKDKRKKKQKK